MTSKIIRTSIVYPTTAEIDSGDHRPEDFNLDPDIEGFTHFNNSITNAVSVYHDLGPIPFLETFKRFERKDPERFLRSWAEELVTISADRRSITFPAYVENYRPDILPSFTPKDSETVYTPVFVVLSIVEE